MTATATKPKLVTATTPGYDFGRPLGPLQSRLVEVEKLPWTPTPYKGIDIKVLMKDDATGLMTALFRWQPGSVLPDHEHVEIEQTLVLEGKLVDKEGPDAGLEVGPGEFVWRPGGSRHVAWCPEGGLMLAMFQIPNKFFERDGRVTDANGHDWESIWGAALAE